MPECFSRCGGRRCTLENGLEGHVGLLCYRMTEKEEAEMEESGLRIRTERIRRGRVGRRKNRGENGMVSKSSWKMMEPGCREMWAL